ncbi:hypothetical protein TNCT_731671, partial [Trichonephila clavata]
SVFSSPSGCPKVFQNRLPDTPRRTSSNESDIFRISVIQFSDSLLDGIERGGTLRTELISVTVPLG